MSKPTTPPATNHSARMLLFRARFDRALLAERLAEINRDNEQELKKIQAKANQLKRQHNRAV